MHPHYAYAHTQRRQLHVCYQPVTPTIIIRSMKAMVFSTYKKQRILHFARLGLKPPTITNELQKGNLKCSRVGIYKFPKHTRGTGSIGRKAGSGRPSKVSAEIKQIYVRGLDEAWWWNNGLPVALTLDRERLFHQSMNHPEVPNSFGMDLQK